MKIKLKDEIRSKQIVIKVGARNSNLSKKQVEEIQATYPHLLLEPIYIETIGDRNRTISLRTIGKTDFFTREIDEMVLSGECRIGIHSAKDLPDPLPKGLELIKLTKGIDPADSLVLRNQETLSKKSIVATSSIRREEMVRKIINDVTFVDIRGTIEERIEKLHRREVDGVVIAEAALIRLGLTQLNRVKLPGPSAPLQGQLAILGRQGDVEIRNYFY
ncbi:MAG: hydroxymethylbilane synthase [Chlamydiales bacterium]